MSRAPRLVGIAASVLAATAVGLIYPLASRGWAWRSVVWDHPLVGLAAREVVEIGGTTFQVRDIRAVGDGSEIRAKLTRL